MPGSGGSAVLPVIDMGPLTGPASPAARTNVAGQIQAACRERGFFYLTGHGVPAGLLEQLADASAEFLALPLADKLEIAMERGGRAWRLDAAGYRLGRRRAEGGRHRLADGFT